MKIGDKIRLVVDMPIYKGIIIGEGKKGSWIVKWNHFARHLATEMEEIHLRKRR